MQRCPRAHLCAFFHRQGLMLIACCFCCIGGLWHGKEMVTQGRLTAARSSTILWTTRGPCRRRRGFLRHFHPSFGSCGVSTHQPSIGWLNGGGSIRMAAALLESAQVPGGLQKVDVFYCLLLDSHHFWIHGDDMERYP